MRRRTLLGLGLGALGALGLWSARPTDHGRPHDAYFMGLNHSTVTCSTSTCRPCG